MSKLAEFIERAMQTGHVRYRLASVARGTEVACGALVDLAGKPESLEGLAADDASALARDALHEYSLVVESEDGAKRSRFPVRVHGGAAPQAEHHVDPSNSGSFAAVIGHLTRLVVDQNKAQTALMVKVLERDTSETQELMKLRRVVARRGEHDITARILDQEAAQQREETEWKRELWTKGFELLGPMAMKALPGGPSSALDKMRESLSAEQSEAVCTILGAGVFAKLMTARDPAKVASLLIEEVSGDAMHRLVAVLTEEQRQVMIAALGKEMRRREEEAKAKAAAATTNGAAS